MTRTSTPTASQRQARRATSSDGRQADIHAKLGITLSSLSDDPLPPQAALQPWEPWPAPLAARLFQEQLEQLQREALGADDVMEVAALLPGSTGLPGAGFLGAGFDENPTFVLVEGGGATVEGQVVKWPA